jgi:hypothetical protein
MQQSQSAAVAVAVADGHAYTGALRELTLALLAPDPTVRPTAPRGPARPHVRTDKEIDRSTRFLALPLFSLLRAHRSRPLAAGPARPGPADTVVWPGESDAAALEFTTTGPPARPPFVASGPSNILWPCLD